VGSGPLAGARLSAIPEGADGTDHVAGGAGVEHRLTPGGHIPTFSRSSSGAIDLRRYPAAPAAMAATTRPWSS
jgi:hypothetical protein